MKKEIKTRKMETMELKELIQNQIKLRKEIIEERKNNINSNYALAKLDFTVIENFEDSKETLEKILKELEDLQNRIIERNNK